jgi:glutathione S-transferase
MKLRITKGSPFARKVRILARETGLAGRIEEVVVHVSPVEDNDDLARENPLVKLPVLELDSGQWLYDSSVICQYLDTLHDATRLFPEAGPARFAMLRNEALTDGMLDAAILCRYEQALRPEALRWPQWIEGQRRKVFGGLRQLESQVDGWPAPYDFGQIGATCALGYLDFRFPQWDWRAQHPRLAGWFGRISGRASVADTLPA